MTWEILAIGNGDLLWQILNGIKLLTQGPWFGLLQVVALLAILGALALVAVKPDGSAGAALLVPLLTILTVVLLTSTITVNVAITDVLDPTARQEVLTDVPIGVALPWWIQSQVSYELTSLINGAFASVGKPTVFEGFMKQQLELQALVTAQLPAGDARQSLVAFLTACVFPNMIGEGRLLSPNELRDTRDLVGAIGSNMVDRVRTTNLYVDGNIAANRTCEQAFLNSDSGVLGIRAIVGADGNGALQAHPDYQKVLHGLMLVTGTSDYAALEDELDTMFVGLTGLPMQTWSSEYGSPAGVRVPLNTVLVRDVWEQAVVSALETDQNVAGVTKQMISTLKRELQYQVFSQSWTLSQWVPMARSLAEGLVLIMAPFGLVIMMANARLFGVGAFIKMFLWLALWWPLLALLDATMYFYAARALRMAMLCPNGASDTLVTWIQQTLTTLGSATGPCQGITLRNYEQIKTLVLSINTVGQNLIASIPVLAGAIVYLGGTIASAVVERVAQSAPNTGGVSSGAGAGRLEGVKYEGGGYLSTWSQETGLTTTAEHRTGTQYEKRSDGSRRYRGLEGSYTTDRFGNVIEGARVTQLADGSTAETTGTGNVQRVRTTRRRADGTSETVEETFNTAGGERRLIGTDTFTRTAEGLTQRSELNAEGRGTIQETGVDRTTGQYVERKLNQDRLGTETRRGVVAVPIVQPDGSIQQVTMDAEVQSRYDAGRATPTWATFKLHDEKGTHLRHGQWDPTANDGRGAYRLVAGETQRVLRTVGAEVDPATGKLALAETSLGPDGTVLTRHYRTGTAAQDESFSLAIHGETLQGKASTFIADDGSMIKLFEGTVTGPEGIPYKTAGLIRIHDNGEARFVQREDLRGLTGEARDFHGRIDGVELEGTRRWQVVNGKLLETFTGLVNGAQGQGLFIRGADGTEHFARLEAKSGLNVQHEDIMNTTRERVHVDREKSVRDRVSEATEPFLWTDPETGQRQFVLLKRTFAQDGTVLTAEFSNLTTGKVWKAWMDPKTNDQHYGIADLVQDPVSGRWRTMNFQETGKAEFDRNGYATTARLGHRGEELYSESVQGQTVRKDYSFVMNYKAEADVSAMTAYTLFEKDLTRDVGQFEQGVMLGFAGAEKGFKVAENAFKTRRMIKEVTGDLRKGKGGKGGGGGEGVRPTPPAPPPGQSGTITTLQYRQSTPTERSGQGAPPPRLPQQQIPPAEPAMGRRVSAPRGEAPGRIGPREQNRQEPVPPN